jgi:hypothetical protein
MSVWITWSFLVCLRSVFLPLPTGLGLYSLLGAPASTRLKAMTITSSSLSMPLPYNNVIPWTALAPNVSMRAKCVLGTRVDDDTFRS